MEDSRFKFRAWNLGDKQYVYFDFKSIDCGLVWQETKDGRIFANVDGYDINYKVDPTEQYTGLKDKNGKEIYEGDIVKGLGDTTKAKVGFQDGCFILITTDRPCLYEEAELLEIIGNIHEHSDLLKTE